MPTDTDALLAFLVAGVLALLLVPLTKWLALRVGAIDHPNERSLHVIPTPKLGGLGILGGVVVAGLLFLPSDSESHAILIGALAIALIGVLDDVFDLPAAPKLLGQTVSVINLIDGVDGLAAGVAVISGVTLATIALSLDRTAAGVLAALTAGAALGFLRWGFPPAGVFMGDTGSNLLGYLLATASVQGALKTNAVVALAFPLVILAVPILDTGFVVAKRLKYRQPIYQADSWHFHHRMANIGFSQRRTLAYLYGWTLALAGLALALRFVPYSDDHGHFDALWTAVIVAFGLVALASSVYLIYVLEILKLRRGRVNPETGEIEAIKLED